MIEKIKMIWKIIFAEEYFLTTSRKNKAHSAFVSDSASKIFIQTTIKLLEYEKHHEIRNNYGEISEEDFNAVYLEAEKEANLQETIPSDKIKDLIGSLREIEQLCDGNKEQENKIWWVARRAIKRASI